MGVKKMKARVRRIKKDIQQGNVYFLDLIAEIMKENTIIYSDNYGEMDEEKSKEIWKVVPFLELLYYGSKHSRGELCEQGFARVVEHNGVLMLLTYYSGPDTFVSIEKLTEVPSGHKVVTVELLNERFQEEEDLKSELRPVIEKYIKAGLTFEEITKYFVDIMRNNN